MSKKVFLLVLLLLALLSLFYYHGISYPVFSPNQNSSVQTSTPPQHNMDSTMDSTENEIVYVTATGECYHRETCRHLQSKIALSKKNAVKKGYRSCTDCYPTP